MAIRRTASVASAIIIQASCQATEFPKLHIKQTVVLTADQTLRCNPHSKIAEAYLLCAAQRLGNPA
jgi:hypothetical protein